VITYILFAVLVLLVVAQVALTQNKTQVKSEAAVLELPKREGLVKSLEFDPAVSDEELTNKVLKIAVRAEQNRGMAGKNLAGTIRVLAPQTGIKK